MKTFLFLGDSVTNSGRDYDNDNDLGCGYVNIIASRLGFERPGELKFVNKGVDGDTSACLYARKYTDVIAFAPDYMTILIGFNDVSHSLHEEDGVAPDRYEQLLGMLIEDITEELPDIKIAILEPFALKGLLTEDKWQELEPGVKDVAKRAKAVAEKYGLSFIPLQEKLNELCQKAPSGFWLADGIHPAPAGHQFLANEIINNFEF